MPSWIACGAALRQAACSPTTSSVRATSWRPAAPTPRTTAAEVNSILRLQEQGGGGALARDQGRAQVADSNDPLQQCDAQAASPLDQNRPQGVKGVDLQTVAIDGRASEAAVCPRSTRSRAPSRRARRP